MGILLGAAPSNYLFASQAIRAAIDKGVNIISMSWSVEANLEDSNMERSNTQGLNEGHGIGEAVQAAHEAGILMFCSSSDGGNFERPTYPAYHNTDRVFRIGAADAAGQAYKWAGTAGDLDYILPGVDVLKQGRHGLESSNLVSEGLRNMETTTGSSVATAFAAGLAAMLLTCARMGDIQRAEVNSSSKTGVTMSDLQKHTRMKKALDFLDLTDNKYMQVWKKLNTSEWGRFHESDAAGKLAIIAQKAASSFAV